jgi:hypothetical protein
MIFLYSEFMAATSLSVLDRLPREDSFFSVPPLSVFLLSALMVSVVESEIGAAAREETMVAPEALLS